MKKLSLIQLSLGFLSSVLLWFYQGPQEAGSFAIGAFAIWYGLISWGLGMSLIFQKKYIALAVSIIVFKYAVLGVIVYWLVHQKWTHLLWFALGIASFMITALFHAITEALNEEKNDVI